MLAPPSPIMNRAQRRAVGKKKRQPKSINVNPMFDALNNSRQLTPAETVDEHLRTRASFERLVDGTASVEDFDDVAMRINMVTRRTEEINPKLGILFSAAHDALNACKDRYLSGKGFGFNGKELTDMREAMDNLETIVDASSRRQMIGAWNEAVQSVRQQIKGNKTA